MSSDPSTAQENVWLDRWRFEEAESAYQEHLSRLRCGDSATGSQKCEKSKGCPGSSSQQTNTSAASSSLASEIAKAREYIQRSLHDGSSGGSSTECFMKRINSLETENKEIRQIAKNLESLVGRLTERVSALEKGSPAKPSQESAPKPASSASAAEKNQADNADEDDDFELFGSEDEEEDAEADRVKQERLKAYEEKKSKKPQLIAKSNIVLEVKPWDDETDMGKLEECVRSIVMDGLLWGASRLVPLAYGIRKLQISCVVEDDKVSTEDLEEKITAFEDYIQSMDIASFNKV